MAIIERETAQPDVVLPDPRLSDSDYLLLAAEEIEEHGWCQGSYHSPSGKHCVIGAIRKVTENIDSAPCWTPDSLRVEQALVAYMERAVWKEDGASRGNVALVDWNDALPREQGQQVVAATLREAAAAFR